MLSRTPALKGQGPSSSLLITQLNPSLGLGTRALSTSHSRWGHLPHSLSIPGTLGGMLDLRPQPRPSESKSVVFYKILRDPRAKKSENH